MAASKTTTLLVARESFGCEVDGAETLVSQGTRVPDDHPVVLGREHLFGPAEPDADVDTPKRTRRTKT